MTTNIDAEYRRGAVLGLTVAEIFILLLFLLLLALLALTRDWAGRGETMAEELDKTRRQLVVVNKQLQEWKYVIEEFQRPEEVDTLVLSLTETRRQLAVTNEQLQEWKYVIEEFQRPEEVDTLASNLAEAERQAEQYRQRAATIEGILEQDENTGRKEMMALREQVENLRQFARAAQQDAEQAKQDMMALREQVENLQQSAQAAQQGAEQAKQELRVAREKGHNPPCWYETVPDGKGGMREKPHYTFNVAVFDEAIIVRQAPIPPGSAVDDNGPLYSVEAARLGLTDLPYNVPLSNESLIGHLKPVHDAGKNATVRSYSCIFWVRVWDKTSPDAKARWKDAHDRVLEGLFGAYTVTNDPWL